MRLNKNKHRLGFIVKGRRQEALAAYIMLAPDLLGILVFLVVSILYSAYISFFKWDALSDKVFVGLHNFQAMMTDSLFWDSVLNTLQYTLIYVPSIFVISLALAVLVQALSEKRQGFFRTAFFLPYTMSPVVASTVWIFIFDPKKGYLNNVLSWIGIPSQTFLSTPRQALASVAVVGIWLVCGYNMVVFIAALKDVPKSYYESAEIDGASTIRKFWHITLPSIKNTSSFILITTTITSFQVFDQIKVMTKGGPARSTMVSVYYIYKSAFEQYNFGYASALAISMALIIALLTILQFKVIKINEEA
jgi:multiple sugar transport system permease protein